MDQVQEEGRDWGTDIAAASCDQELVKLLIKRELEQIEPLHSRFERLLQGRHVTADDDLRSFRFIACELKGIPASWCQVDYVDENFLTLLAKLRGVVKDIEKHLDEYKKALQGNRAQETQCLVERLSRVTEVLFWYSHLLPLDDGDGTYSYRVSSSAEPHPYAIQTEVNADRIPLIGIENAQRKLLRWSIADQEDNNKTLKIISIVGPAGVGKTALAMEVYRQLQQIGSGSYFECCATAQVSRRPEIKKLLWHILSQIDEPAAISLASSNQPSQVTELEDEQELLVRNINQCLQHKRYLILIDDIWNESVGYIIKNAFLQNNRGSRIIITTRSRRLAHFCCSHSDGLVHVVNPLNELDSVKLLLAKAFGPEKCCTPESLKPVCDVILRRCEGLPLLITVMADWLKNQQPEMQQSFTTVTSFEQAFPQLLKQFEHMLCPSCDDFPYDCSLFQNDVSMLLEQGFSIDKERLIRTWTTYLRESKADAEEYFSRLVDRNVITRVAANWEHSHITPNDWTWQINHFMLQFLSRSTKMGLVCTNDAIPSVPAGGVDQIEKLRRLSLHQPDLELGNIINSMDFFHTRSLTISGKVDGIPLNKFMHLLVLDLENWQCFKEKDLSLICKMFLLRYLSLRNTGVSKLPSEIKDLHLLEHLIVGSNETGTEIPKEIEYLKLLRTLSTVELNECSTSLLEALGAVSTLQVVAITWSFQQCIDIELQKALCSSIKKWTSLTALTVHCGLGCFMDFLVFPDEDIPIHLQKFRVTGGTFVRVPQWFLRLDSITLVEITVCRLQPDDLTILGSLSSLECLVLGLHYLLEEVMVIDETGFHELQRLSVSCRVPWLTFNQGAMPSLTHLEMKIRGSQRSSDSFPSGISNLLCLWEVALHYDIWYASSPNVVTTVKAVQRGVADHPKPINLIINGIQGGDLETVEEELARITESQAATELEG